MDRVLENLVWQRAGDQCEYCGMPQHLDPLPFEIDHIVPEFHHGTTTASNLCSSCLPCNRKKGTNLAGIDRKKHNTITKLFHPRRHSWSRHFKWDGPVLVGRTAIGRVTVDVLGINDHLRLWQRRELIEEGVFPIK